MTIAALRPGDYVVVRTGGLAGLLIRLVTRSRYNHVAIVDDDGWLIEATPRHGVQRAHPAEYGDDAMLSNFLEPTTPGQRMAVAAFAAGLLGEPYNWSADVCDGLSALGLRWRLLTRLEAGRRAVMCSQLVAEAGVGAGLPAWQCGKPTAAAVVPGDLAARIEKSQWT